MSYQWGNIIAPGETIQKEFTVSLRFRQVILGGTIILAIILAFQNIFVGVMILLLGLLYWWYMSAAKHYAFTNKRVVLMESFITRNIISIDYVQITDIEIDQNVFDLMGRWGTITINSAGTHVPEVNLQFIDNPQSIKQSLDQIRDTKTT